jgi:hypothetical protein
VVAVSIGCLLHVRGVWVGLGFRQGVRLSLVNVTASQGLGMNEGLQRTWMMSDRSLQGRDFPVMCLLAQVPGMCLSYG